MPQGESSRDKVRLQILTFLLDGPAVSRRIIEACIAGKVTTAKATIYKYLDELLNEGKVICHPQRKSAQTTYELSNKGRKEAEDLLKTQHIMAEIKQWTPQKYEEFMKFRAWMIGSEEGAEFMIWLPNLEHAELVKTFRNVRTKILRQD